MIDLFSLLRSVDWQIQIFVVSGHRLLTSQKTLHAVSAFHHWLIGERHHFPQILNGNHGETAHVCVCELG